jgi:hypothetical protein
MNDLNWSMTAVKRRNKRNRDGPVVRCTARKNTAFKCLWRNLSIALASRPQVGQNRFDCHGMLDHGKQKCITQHARKGRVFFLARLGDVFARVHHIPFDTRRRFPQCISHRRVQSLGQLFLHLGRIERVQRVIRGADGCWHSCRNDVTLFAQHGFWPPTHIHDPQAHPRTTVARQHRLFSDAT